MPGSAPRAATTRADIAGAAAAGPAEAVAGIPGQLLNGRLLNQRYRLTERIATGGMGQVWRGTDTLLGRPVAVKLLSARLAGDEQVRSRFRAEARYAGSLSHPGIARVYDYGESREEADGATGPSPGIPYLVMELVEGEPLSAVLARDGRMTTTATLGLIAQAARALQAAHTAGIVHRDIKPGNLLLTPDDQVKITDFGIARAALDARLTQAGMVMGTAQYVSPEQASARPVTSAADVYSLGVVAYECLAGRPPFTSDAPLALALAHVRQPPPPLPGDVPAPVAALVGQMLAKDPRDRPASAEEVAGRADALHGEDPWIITSAGTAGPAEWFSDPVVADTAAPAAGDHAPAGDRAPTAALMTAPPRPARSRRAAAVAAVAAAVLAAALGVIAAVATTRHPGGTVSTSGTPAHHVARPSGKASGTPVPAGAGTSAPSPAARSPAASPSASPSPRRPSPAASASVSPSPSPSPTGSPTPTPSSSPSSTPSTPVTTPAAQPASQAGPQTPNITTQDG